MSVYVFKLCRHAAIDITSIIGPALPLPNASNGTIRYVYVFKYSTFVFNGLPERDMLLQFLHTHVYDNKLMVFPKLKKK